MKTRMWETVYGMNMPVWAYFLDWTCGHESFCLMASNTPMPLRSTMSGPCPKCYAGPFTNSFD